MLNDAELGFALFFTACGLLFSIPLVPILNRQLGIGFSTKIGILLLAVMFNFPLLATTYFLLCLSLFLVGIFSGFTDVSMNAMVSIIESREKKHLMSAAHGFFSLGGFFGAGVGTLLLLRFSQPSLHMFIVSVFVVITNGVLAKYYQKIDETSEKRKRLSTRQFFKTLRPVLGLSVVAFIVMFNEGAVEHWSNLFLNEVVGIAQNKAGYGFILFSLCMTIGRFQGDGFSFRYGSVKTLVWGCGVALVGYSLILWAHTVSSVLGFGALGLGLSAMIPEIYRLAGDNNTIPTSVAISIVSGVGFIGFMVGPVLLGVIAKQSTLIFSYVFLLFSLICALGIVLFIRK